MYFVMKDPVDAEETLGGDGRDLGGLCGQALQPGMPAAEPPELDR